MDGNLIELQRWLTQLLLTGYVMSGSLHMAYTKLAMWHVTSHAPYMESDLLRRSRGIIWY